MNETHLKAIKNIYKIIFDVSNIYEDVLNELMSIYSNKKPFGNELLAKMVQMTKSIKIVLDEADKVTFDMEKSLPDAELEEGIDNTKGHYYYEFQNRVSNNLIEIAKDALEAINISIAYFKKISSNNNIFKEKELVQNNEEIFEEIDKLILQKEEELHQLLIDKIRDNINNIHILIEYLQKTKFN